MKKSMISKGLMLLTVAATLLSFSPMFGGEGFEISLNGKTVVQRYGPNLDDIKTLQLNPGSINDQLTIKYHHCGRVGKNRIVSLKDSQNKTVKEWRFADVNEPVAAMNCNVKEFLSVKNTGTLKLYYSSSELPKGRLLANVIISNNSVAKQ